MTNYPAEHMDEVEFVEMARQILEKFGVECYEDNLIKITTNYNGLDLEVERKAQPVDCNDPKVGHLRVSNPTTIVTRKGDIIRHHGEHCYLVPHMKELVK
jgi:predicted metalloenzyme YecM